MSVLLKSVDKWSGLFVTPDGRVWSVPRKCTSNHKGKWLKLRPGKQGYVNVTVYRADGTWLRRCVHRMIAEAFIPNPLNKPCINHINANRADNRVVNLEWCTHQENTTHTWKLGRSRQQRAKAAMHDTQ